MRLYLSVADATGNVERNLGDVAFLCGRHLGPVDPAGRTVSALLEVYLDGPQREADVAGKAAAVAVDMAGKAASGTAEATALAFTPFLRECQRSWIAEHGRRFCLPVAPRRARGGGPRRGTDRMVQAMQRSCAASMVKLAGQSNPAGTPCILGGTLAGYSAGGGEPLPSTGALERF